jgi:hypothetical protein
MLLITIFVELRVVAGRSRMRAGRPKVVSRRPCCAVALRRKAWSEHGMGAAWQVWIRHGRTSVNQMEKTHSKPLAAWHGRGMAWARHDMCESAFRVCTGSLNNHPCCTPQEYIRMPTTPPYHWRGLWLWLVRNFPNT